MAASGAQKANGIPEEEFNKKWDDLQNYVVLRKSKDPRFGEIIVLKNKAKKELIFSKEKWVNSKASAAQDIADMKARASLNHPNLQRFLGYSTAVDKGLCATNYLIIGYYEFPKSDLYKELQDKVQTAGEFSPDELRWMAIESLHGLQFLHQQKKIHGDIRPLHVGIDREERRVQLLDRLNDSSPEDRAQLNNLQATKEMYLSPELWAKIKGVKGAEYQKNKNDSFALGMTLLHAGVLHNVQDVYKADGSFNRERLEKYLAEFDAKYGYRDPQLVRIVRGLLHEDEQLRWDTPDGAIIQAARPSHKVEATPDDVTASNIPTYIFQSYANTYAQPAEVQDGKVVTVVRPDGSTYTYIQRNNPSNNVIYNYDQSKLVYVQPFQPVPNVQYITPTITESSGPVRPSFVTVQRSLSPNYDVRAPTVVSTSVEVRRGSSIPYAPDQKAVLKKYEIKDDKLIEIEAKKADWVSPGESARSNLPEEAPHDEDRKNSLIEEKPKKETKVEAAAPVEHELEKKESEAAPKKDSVTPDKRASLTPEKKGTLTSDKKESVSGKKPSVTETKRGSQVDKRASLENGRAA